jgi:phage terminase large subunit-like protein
MPKGQLLDFDEIEKEIGEFIENHRVVLLTYDAALIRQMCSRLSQKVWAREFSQQRDRLVADKGLLDSIMQRTIVHDGSHLVLRKHLMNADKKTDADERKLRIVKRSANLKIDGAVSLSMGREWASSTKINLGLA